VTKSLEALVRRLDSAYGTLDARSMLRDVLLKEFPQRIALVSSFGAESAVLLDMVAEINPHVPVLFVDTGKLFAQTSQYKDQLVQRLGLSDVRVLRPDAQGLDFLDADGSLWQRNPDGCCFLRKTVPLEQGLSGFDAWISGRKRFHGATRSDVPVFEAQDGRIKINPLAAWDRRTIDAWFEARGLPRHPLEAQGYASIGCHTCTRPIKAGEAVRDGRWSGLAKTECGIHNRPGSRVSTAGRG